MSAEFQAVQTALDPGALRLRVAFEIRNRSAAPWRAARAKLVPKARAEGIYTDEDVFKIIS